MATEDFQSVGGSTVSHSSIRCPVEQLETYVTDHATVREFQKRRHCQETTRLLRFQEEDIPYNLTETTLAGLDMITTGPVFFTDDETGSVLAFYHLGPRLAGHSGIVHGGLAAVLLDECLGRACFPKLAGNIGVTAKLDLAYKSPIAVRSVVLIRASTTRVEGRKAWAEGSIENAHDGRLHVQAKALFIEPKWAADMPPVM
jgi:acyl-coenzyme A thioesterase PaaI-like protein